MKKFFNGKIPLVLISVILLFVMFFGVVFANSVARSGGKVTFSEVSIMGSEDNIVSAFLLKPKTATADNPVPAVVLFYGGTGIKDFMVNTAIELARHGMVALAVDSSGSAFSEYTSSNVGVDAVGYVRGLNYVDTENVGLVGMSFGMMTIESIASAQPDWYKSMFYMGIYTFKPAELVATYKNIGSECGLADETQDANYTGDTYFDNPFWTETLLYGLDVSRAEPDVVYGDIDAETARLIYAPNLNHPQTTEAKISIGNTVDWMMRTLNPKTNLDAYNTIFQWKKFFLSISFLALIAFIFTSGTHIVTSNYFSDVVKPLPEYNGFKGAGYWLGVVITTLTGPLLYIAGVSSTPFKNMGFNSMMPFQFANYYVSWMLLVAVVTVVILVVSYLVSMRKTAFKFADTGLSFSPTKILKSFSAALLIMGTLYVLVAHCYGWFRLPVTLAGLQIPYILRPFNSLTFPYLLNYFVLYLPFFLVLGVLFYGFLRPKDGTMSLGKEMAINSAVLAGGALLFLLLYYVPLYAGAGHSPLLAAWSQLHGNMPGAMTGISLIYFIPVPLFNVLTACVLTYFNKKTGNVWLGAILMALLFAWIQVTTAGFGGGVIG